MTLRLTRTRQAEADLIEIWTRIARENIPAADRLLDALDDRSHRLTAHPFLGAARPDLAPELRYLTFGSYLILYRVLPTDIEIVRYLHGRRDLQRLVESS